MQAKIKDLFASTTEIIASKLASLTSLFSSKHLERLLPDGGIGSLSKLISKVWPSSMPGSLNELFDRIMTPCSNENKISYIESITDDICAWMRCLSIALTQHKLRKYDGWSEFEVYQ